MKLNLDIKIKILFLVIIEVILCFSPFGAIPIGTIVATLSIIPVVVAALTFSKKVGAFMGFIFGMCSFIYWTFIMPTHPMAFCFTPIGIYTSFHGNFGSIIVCFVPRILAGIIPALIIKRNKNMSILASAIGSLTNTFFVFIFVLMFFSYQCIDDLIFGMFIGLLSMIIVNGIWEAIVCAILSPIIYTVLKK